MTTIIPSNYVLHNGFWYGPDGSGPYYFNSDGTGVLLGGGGSFSSLTGNPTDNTALASALAAKANTSLVTGRMWAINGAPTTSNLPNAVSGDEAVRVDKPFAGVMYTFNGTTWAITDNSYTISTLPTPSSANLGLIITVTDACHNGSGNTSPLAFECVTYDGGTTYYWVPVGRIWPVYRNRTASTPTVGTGADQIVDTFNLPNSSYVYCPLMDVDVAEYVDNTATTSGGASRTIYASIKNASTTLMSQAITSGATTLVVGQAQRIHVSDSVGSQFCVAISAGYDGIANTTAESAFTFTLPNLAINFIIFAPSTETCRLRQRDITFYYP